MEQLKVNPNNKKYYSEDFIKGFECGVKRQFEVDRKEGEWITQVLDTIYGKQIRLECSECGDVFNVTEKAFAHEKYCRYCGAKMKVNESIVSIIHT